MNKISGQIVDVLNEKIFSGTIHFENEKIINVVEEEVANANYIIPGFIDAHVHIESSMLTPSEFGRMALPHGTVATISDPHEIANVLGLEGVKYMIEDAKNTALKINFGAPSCVPATIFETAGATIDLKDIDYLLKEEKLIYLSEMMNFPGVLFNDKVVMDKIELAKKYGVPIDGHAPGLRGEDAQKYIDAGITTDHECFTYDEALDKLNRGMKILIREGSAAKNFEALIPLANDHYKNMMLCSDDKHPNDLEVGHINELVLRALGKGVDLFKVLRMACVNPVLHYKMDSGLLRVGDPADFIVVDHPEKLNILQTYINGVLVAENGQSKTDYKRAKVINHFNAEKKKTEDFQIKSEGGTIRVIEAMDGQLITNPLLLKTKEKEGFAISDTEHDILKITVVNRYSNEPPAVAFIKNIGLKSGAIASSVAHDSHNIVCVGVTDEDICAAVNALIDAKGGLSLSYNNSTEVLPLPVAGIMTHENGYEVAAQYTRLDQMAKELGTKLNAPFMTLSFMALLVIPSLKLSDLGLFDGNKFEFVSLFGDEV